MSEAKRDIMARLLNAGKRASPEAIEDERRALPDHAWGTITTGKLLDHLERRLIGNGASCVRVADRNAAVDELSRFTAERYGQRRVVAGHDARLAALPWRDGGLLPRFGAAQSGDAVAVSYAEAAIAESGSLVLYVDRNNAAANNLLAEDHVVLVDQAAVKASLDAVWDDPRWHPAQGDARPPRALMLISGPSSTADIGMQMVLGAHGPRALHVIVIGDG